MVGLLGKTWVSNILEQLYTLLSIVGISMVTFEIFPLDLPLSRWQMLQLEIWQIRER